MAQSEKPLQDDYASADIKLVRMISLVFKLSVMTLGFSIIIFMFCMIGIWVINLATYTLGMLVAYHGVWVSTLMGITSTMGIAGYQNGIFNSYKAKIHAIFVVFSELAIMAGLALSIKSIVDMPVLVSNFPPKPLQSYSVKTLSANGWSSLSSTAYGGAVVIILFYTYFFGYCLFSGYTYYKASKSPQLNNSGLLVKQMGIQQESQPVSHTNYVYEQAEEVGQF